ncbi:hypothetical protein AFLA_001549 [Aspergillus flavus NRRL3357]|nr:hypothetical protein AFLA_001549 [Aspergillus flavus NRRL3357]
MALICSLHVEIDIRSILNTLRLQRICGGLIFRYPTITQLTVTQCGIDKRLHIAMNPARKKSTFTLCCPW